MASLPSQLREALTGKIENRYPAEGGVRFVELPWRVPTKPSPDVVALARESLPVLLIATEPAGKERLRDWLGTLGTLCSGRTPMSEAQAKLAAYSKLIDVPESVLNRETLVEAGRKFGWFPSFSEITEFLDEKAAPALRARQRVEALIAAAEAP